MGSSATGAAMTADAFASILTSRGYTARKEGAGFRAQCPAHGGEDLNMTIRPHPEGGAVCTCHSHHCTRQAIAEALGLTMNDIVEGSAKSGGPPSGKAAVVGETVYPYRDEAGATLFEVVRQDLADGKKDIWQRLPGQPKGGLGDVRRVLYDLPDLLGTQPGDVIAIAEGEKCCEVLQQHGVVATTNPMGAGKWRQEHTDWLKARLPGRSFVIFPDNDKDGLKHADEVFHSLRKAGLSVRIAAMADLRPKGDVVDYLKTHTDEDLQELLQPERAWRRGEMDGAELLTRTFKPMRWAVKRVLPEGLGIIAGPSKSCKSWLCYDLAVAVASGGKLLGEFDCPQGPVLYLALEDSERRTQDRLLKALKGEALPKGLLTLKWEAPLLGKGGEEMLRDWLDRNQGARLIIVDVMQKIRQPPDKGVTEYVQDYNSLSTLQKIARDYCVSVLLVHHTRKMKADDPYDMISGSTAIQGVSDTLLALMRVRGEDTAVLHVTGRDVDSDPLNLRWDRDLCGWHYEGAAKDSALVKLSDTRKRILKFMCVFPGDVQPCFVAESLALSPSAVRHHMPALAEAGDITRPRAGWYGMNLMQRERAKAE